MTVPVYTYVTRIRSFSSYVITAYATGCLLLRRAGARWNATACRYKRGAKRSEKHTSSASSNSSSS